jgi:hypothetical protein
MTSEKKFVVGFVTGLSLTLGVFYGVFLLQLGVPTSSSQWSWAINAKKRQLAEAAGSPKLLLVGGSSILFGLRAREIQAKTGVPTVNMGTHFALGSEYILHLARKVARPGDTVLLAFEYEAYADQFRDELFYDYLLARDPDYFNAMSLYQRVQTAMFISGSRLQRGLRRRGKPFAPAYFFPYDIKQINEFGDLFGATDDIRPAGHPYLASTSQILAVQGVSLKSRGFVILADFICWARQNRIRLLAAFPSICHRQEYESPTARRVIHDIEGFYASLGVPVVGTAEEAMLPPDLCFDTFYHSTEKGAQERTKRLLTYIEPMLKTSGSGAKSANVAQ